MLKHLGAGHLQIEQNGIRLEHGNELQTFDTLGRMLHGVAELREDFLEHVANMWFVVDDEHAPE